MVGERLARWSVRTVLVAGVLAVIGGAVSAALWRPDPARTAPPDSCPDPPCFGGGGLPGVESLPAVAPVALLGVAVLLGGLSLLLGLLAALRGRGRAQLMLSVVALVGALLVLIGGEVLPHLLSPCAPAQLWNAPAPSLCVRSPHGLDVPERWHALNHAVVGFLPLSLALNWWWSRRAARVEVA